MYREVFTKKKLFLLLLSIIVGIKFVTEEHAKGYWDRFSTEYVKRTSKSAKEIFMLRLT